MTRKEGRYQRESCPGSQGGKNFKKGMVKRVKQKKFIPESTGFGKQEGTADGK